jgi:valyl-tRNA synthetase
MFLNVIMAEINMNDFQYDFKEAEKRILDFWLKEKIYKFNEKRAKNKKKIYSIDTPPPTVSGKMHIGHAFSYSQQDFIVRFRRMFEGTVFYPFGTDDNGLPTERLVEKTMNVKSKNMSREEFIKLCYDFLKKELPAFVGDWKAIGSSCDFDLYYSTINDYSRKISQRSFLDIYNKNRAYRKKAPFMWCPECQTAIAQYELKDKEENSDFAYISFDTSIGEKITIATTRPELMPACVAIHVNPKDKKYKKFIGKNAKAKLPIFDREVQISGNEDVDMNFGTGAVYHCTFGDMDDVKWIEEKKISPIEIMNNDGTLSEKAGKYSGMKSREARKAIIEDLKKLGRIEKIEKINNAVKVHERCEVPIEILMTNQWFVKYLDLKKDMLKWGEKLKWHPEFMKTRYDNWVNGLKWDWCISRQRYFGVAFPVWYCGKCGEIVVAEEKQLPVNPLTDKPLGKCKKCGSKDFIGERDILDTWFTSSMTPRLATELVDEKIRGKIFPMSLRPQAHDIITFWLFNTVFKSNMHYGKNPFSDVIVSGFVTLDGEKMSKSKGNVIEPRSVLENYGADCLRYWASSSKLGEDVNYQEKDLITGKKFVTKLWNATKFVFMNLGEYKNFERPKKIEKIDELFLAELNKVIKNSTEAFLNYEYSRAKAETESFFWKSFCDNYLEIVKNRIYNGTNEEKESAKYVLYNSLFTIVKLMAPFTPFITEEVYQKFFKNNETGSEKSIHLCEWASEFKVKTSKEDEKTWLRFTEILEMVRKEKSIKQKSMKAEIILDLRKEDMSVLGKTLVDLKAVCCAKEIKEGKELKIYFTNN